MGDSSPMVKEERERVCDFCGESIALLYCRADSAKLCLSCDRQVHSTNQLFTKHGRSLLCDACDSSPASIFCTTHNSVLCQNCDWESHGLSLSSLHDRRPLEGFTGCPSVTELLTIAGFEDVGKKGLFGDGLVDSDPYGSDDGFSDFLVWDTPSFVSLDDLIVSGGSDHQFQAMGVPPLPKNRNAACGQHKEELFDQLREMAKLEPNMNDGQGDVEQPLLEFHSLVPEHNIQLQDTSSGFECDTKPTLIPSYEANEHQWCSDRGEAADKDLSSTLLGSYIDNNCLVPDKDSDIGNSLSHANGDHEQQSWRDVVTETLQVPKFAARELTSQDRDTAISRYKEKKKTRRYDKHIRYESRKVRAESRTRIRGRFAKMDH